MEGNEFLDTNIVLDYINYNKKSSSKIKKSYDYVLNAKGKIILCGMVIYELNKINLKKSRIHKAVLCLLEDENYSLSEILSKKEEPFAKKLHARFKEFNKERLSELFSQERTLFEIGLEKFLKFKVFKRVISLQEIDMFLANEIGEYIENIDDCKILASALQFQKDQKELFNFVTSDVHDFDPNTYDYLKDQEFFSTYKFPKLVNLGY